MKRAQTQSKKARKGLRRPRVPLSFQVDTRQRDDPPVSSANVSAAVASLEKQVLLLNLIIRRNKNQHRNQLFFKRLSLLRSSLTKLLDISSRLSTLSHLASSAARTSEQVRRDFETEAHLRSHKEFLQDHVREVLVPRCYVTFSSLVSDSQFANLGVVLVAALSEIACGKDGVGAVRTVQIEEKPAFSELIRMEEQAQEEKDIPLSWPGSLVGTNTKITGEDHGEVVERVYDRHPSHNVIEDVDVATEAAEPTQIAVTDEEKSIRISPVRKATRNASGTQAGGWFGSGGINEPAELEQTSTKKGRWQESQEDGRKRKGKKSQNAIDDLFRGLL